MTKHCNAASIFKRELKSYFQSPIAYVFMIVFLALSGFLTFALSQFYERGSADLQPFFFWHPWVYLLLVPAATMGLWAEERKTGTIELLLTMPITTTEAIVGKFLAAWAFIVLALALTFPIVLTTAYLGDPDMGVIACGYLGSVLLSGAYVSIGMLTSSMTRNQVISFVLSLSFCFLLLLIGFPPMTGFFVRWAPAWFVNGIAAFSLLPHFESIQRGVVDIRDIAYYASIILFMGAATHVVISNRKAG